MGGSKPTVTLTLAGDEKKLTEAFDRVGAASKSMADQVDESSHSMRSASDRIEATTEGFDTVDTRAMGFRDTLTGLQDGFQGLTNDSDSLMETLLLVGFGIGDLASGFVNFIIPAVTTFWTTLTTSVIPAVWSFTSALLANPITWVVIGIVALIAIIVLLVKHWDWVKEAAGNTVGWIRDRWNDLMGWFSGIPDWFGRIFSGVGDAIAAAFKGSINWVIDRLNWLVDRANDLIYGINVVSPFADIPNIPHIPKLHTGGIVPGIPGQEVPIIAMGGERVTATGQAAAGGAFRLVAGGGADSAAGTFIDALIRNGDITLVPA